MVELSLIALSTACVGGLAAWWARAQQVRGLHHVALQPTVPVTQTVTLSSGGLYRLSTPEQLSARQAFADLAITPADLMLTNAHDRRALYFPLSAIQWLSAPQSQAEGISILHLHLEVDERWLILSLTLPQAEMTTLLRILRWRLPHSHLPSDQPVGPVAARLVYQDWQGVTELGPAVGLYLLPHLLVVLKEGRVQAKLSLASVRRVLAVERQPGRLEQWWGGLPDGLVNLYSMSETAVFALSDHESFAGTLAGLAGCTLEVVQRDDKAAKG